MSSYLPRSKGTRNIVLVFIFFILIVVIVPQNAVAEEIRQVDASEILEKIAEGKLVAEEDCIIIDDLDLNKIRSNLSSITVNGRKLYIVNNSFSIKNSIIKGNVSFNDCYFSNPVNFDGTTITGIANFETSFLIVQPTSKRQTLALTQIS